MAAGFRTTAIAGLVFQASVASYQLLVPALIVRQHDDPTLGLWLTIYALFGLALTTNLGVPGAVLSLIDAHPGEPNAKPAWREREQANARYVRAALTLTFACAAVPIALSVVAPAVPWSRLLDIPASVEEPGLLFGACLFMTGLSLLAYIATPLHLALHRARFAYLTISAAHVLAIPLLVLGASADAPFWVFGACVLLPPVAGGLFLWLVGFRRGYVRVARAPAPDALRIMWRTGMAFLAMDTATSIILRTPELILNATQDATAVAQFSVVMRSTVLLNAVVMVTLQPLWPSLGAAQRAGEPDAARAVLKKALLTVLGMSGAFVLALLLLGRFVMARWMGESFVYPPILLPLAAVMGVAQSLHYWTTIGLVGIAARRENLKVSAVMLLTYVPAAILLSLRYGPAGMYVALIAVFGLVGAPLGAWQLRRKIRELGAPAP